MMELDDCGKYNIIMVIKAPRGTMTLLKQGLPEYSKHLGQTFGDAQCEAIKVFMEEHNDQA